MRSRLNDFFGSFVIILRITARQVERLTFKFQIMKKLFTIALGLLTAASSVMGAKTEEKNKINVEPPFWWVGMANDTLQLTVNAPGIAGADFSVNYPGVRIESQVKLDSPNYKFLYLIINPETKPGTLKIDYTLDGKKIYFGYLVF